MITLCKSQSWQRVRRIRCNIPCWYGTVGWGDLFHDTDTRWPDGCQEWTITTLSPSLKLHCPGEESIFFGPRFKIAEQPWETVGICCRKCYCLLLLLFSYCSAIYCKNIRLCLHFAWLLVHYQSYKATFTGLYNIYNNYILLEISAGYPVIRLISQ